MESPLSASSLGARRRPPRVFEPQVRIRCLQRIQTRSLYRDLEPKMRLHFNDFWAFCKVLLHCTFSMMLILICTVFSAIHWLAFIICLILLVIKKIFWGIYHCTKYDY